MPVELVIFDCDGVLVDSERLAVEVQAAYISELGWTITPSEVFERFVGRPDSFVTAEVERTLGAAVPDFMGRYEERLYAAFRSELVAVRGIDKALDSLDTIGLQTCVASSGSHEKMKVTLGLTGLLERFAGRIYSGTEVEAGKPAPDLFLYAARCSQVDPQSCVVVEDSKPGVEAARAAGMRSFGFVGGITPAAWLAGPDTIVFNDMDLLAGLISSLEDVECDRRG